MGNVDIALTSREDHTALTVGRAKRNGGVVCYFGNFKYYYFAKSYISYEKCYLIYTTRSQCHKYEFRYRVTLCVAQILKRTGLGLFQYTSWTDAIGFKVSVLQEVKHRNRRIIIKCSKERPIDHSIRRRGLLENNSDGRNAPALTRERVKRTRFVGYVHGACGGKKYLKRLCTLCAKCQGHSLSRVLCSFSCYSKSVRREGEPMWGVWGR